MGNGKKEAYRMQNACCDIYRDQTKVVVSLEMPGVARNDLEVKIDGDKLIVHGKKWSSGIKGDYLVREIRSDDYHQEYTIDETIDRNKIEARMDNGLVHITLHIKESEKPRKIQITSG